MKIYPTNQEHPTKTKVYFPIEKTIKFEFTPDPKTEAFLEEYRKYREKLLRVKLPDCSY